MFTVRAANLWKKGYVMVQENVAKISTVYTLFRHGDKTTHIAGKDIFSEKKHLYF